jgi:putative peptidoglycan lipid II flippase
VRRGSAALVAAGIFFSRVFGLIRQRVISHYLGQTFAADAFYAAFRIPNFLQNLFGEGVLSASFIPEYTKLVAKGRPDDANRLAGAVAGLLGTVVAVIVALGVTGAPWLVDLIVPGFRGERRVLAVELVRILFPGVGFLVLSAWCLGVLNAHRRFFLSYAAPVIWNLAIIAAAIVPARSATTEQLVVWMTWGAVAGSVLQFAIQLPTVLRLTGGVRLSLDRTTPGLTTVVRNFGPAFVSRGVVQISGFFDAMIGSLLPIGAVATVTNAQLLYTLPISLFGMSIAAAELPELSERAARDEGLLDRLRAGTGQVAFFIVPTALAFLALGDQVTRLVFQSGAFTDRDTTWVWATLAGSTAGLLPQAWARLLNSTYYALGDTKTPLRFALIRVTTALALGLLAALLAPKLFGFDPRWGTVGLSLATAVAGTVEYFLLRRELRRRLGAGVGEGAPLARLAAAGVAAVLVGLGVIRMGNGWPRMPVAIAALASFGVVYLVVTRILNVPESDRLLRRVGLGR